LNHFLEILIINKITNNKISKDNNNNNSDKITISNSKMGMYLIILWAIFKISQISLVNLSLTPWEDFIITDLNNIHPLLLLLLLLIMVSNSKCLINKDNNNNFHNNNSNNNLNSSINNNNSKIMIIKDTLVLEIQDLTFIVWILIKIKKRKNNKKKNYMRDKLHIGKKKEIKHLKIRIMILLLQCIQKQ